MEIKPVPLANFQTVPVLQATYIRWWSIDTFKELKIPNKWHCFYSTMVWEVGVKSLPPSADISYVISEKGQKK